MMGMFFIAPKVTAVKQTICNKLCSICNLNLCMKNAEYDNNINGYVVTLTTGYPNNNSDFPYSCLHHFFIKGHHEIDNIPISAETIHKILNIDGKADALIGTDFYK